MVCNVMMVHYVTYIDFLADKVYVRRSAVREVADKRLPLLNEYLKVKNFCIFKF